jgi:hypothetical protein
MRLVFLCFQFNPSLQLIQMLQPRQNNLFTRLLHLASQEHLVENSVHLNISVSHVPRPPLPSNQKRIKTKTHLVEIKYQIQLTHIPKKAIQHLDEEVYGLQVRELVIVRVDAGAEEESCVPAVHDLVVAELDEVRLVLLVSRGD